MVNMEFELEPWVVPNNIRIKIGIGRFSESLLVPLCDVDAYTLSLQCDKFRADIFAKAGVTDPKETCDSVKDLDMQGCSSSIVVKNA